METVSHEILIIYKSVKPITLDHGGWLRHPLLHLID